MGGQSVAKKSSMSEFIVCVSVAEEVAIPRRIVNGIESKARNQLKAYNP